MSTTPEQTQDLPEDAQRLLSAVDASISPEPGESASGEGPALATDYRAEAELYTDMLADTVESAGGGVVQYGPKTRKRVADALAPVLEKYEGRMPEWLAKWWPELMLGWTLAPIAYQTARAFADAKNAAVAAQQAEGAAGGGAAS